MYLCTILLYLVFSSVHKYIYVLVEHFNKICYFEIELFIVRTENLLFCKFCNWKIHQIFLLFVVLELEELGECQD